MDISQKPRELGYLNACIDAGLLDALAIALKTTSADHSLTKHTFNTLCNIAFDRPENVYKLYES